jgi:hypothetical protein
MKRGFFQVWKGFTKPVCFFVTMLLMLTFLPSWVRQEPDSSELVSDPPTKFESSLSNCLTFGNSDPFKYSCKEPEFHFGFSK